MGMIISSIRQIPRWLWWNTIYAPLKMYWWLWPNNPRRNLFTLLQVGWRTRAIWAIFRPNVFHNEDGKLWHVTLEDSNDYVQLCSLPVEIMRDQDDGHITGFIVYDEVLADPDYYKSEYPYDKFKAKCRPKCG